ncbi:hypothetical protein D6D24_08216 [Aureobasidium pullulans]|uniref:DUF7492 domain-containing protein n=1 Tax=Aureobasidium pullulans TaxID=5580 RepID=A0A4S8VF03_AURPU|nr:hypothetical protein D6D24_08216 [Aureobasidium pullulans]
MKFILSIAAIAAVLGQASAHSWVEEMQIIDPATGNFTGDYGYTRGYVARTDPGFGGESMKYLLPPLDSGRTRIDNTDLLCHPSQRTSNYDNAAYPRLSATPGSFVAMKYLENGHVTLPLTQSGKPKAGGTVFVYGTTKPSSDEKIAEVLKWNTAGNGGDSRGVQLAAQNYDDGRCHQINGEAMSVQRQTSFPDKVGGQSGTNVEMWCETDVHIPTSYKAGDTLTVYWVWQWPSDPDPKVYPNGKDEYYTSCAEIDIVDSVSNAAPVHTLLQQDPQFKAVSDFKSRTALTTSAVIILAGSASGSASATSVAASSTPAPSAMASSAAPSSMAPSSVYSSVAISSSSTKSGTSESTNLPNPLPPFANSSSSSSGPTMIPSNPFFNPSGQLPSFVTVTNYVTMSDVAHKQQGTKTTTEFVTSYVTAPAPTVVVPASSVAPAIDGLPTIVAVPDAAGNAGLIGRFARR